MITEAKKTRKSPAIEGLVEKIVEKVVYRDVTSTPYTYTGTSFSVPIEGRTTGFTISLSPTGCGLGLFSNFTGINATGTSTFYKELQNLLKDLCKKRGLYSLLSTLGDNHRTYLPILTNLGFKEITKYNNANYSGNYMQTLYFLDFKDI